MSRTDTHLKVTVDFLLTLDLSKGKKLGPLGIVLIGRNIAHIGFFGKIREKTMNANRMEFVNSIPEVKQD